MSVFSARSSRLTSFQEFAKNFETEIATAISQRDDLQQQVDDYSELLLLLIEFESKQSPTHDLLMSLGSKFHVQTQIDTRANILLNLGLDTHVELSIPEALRYLESYLGFLQQKHQYFVDKVVRLSSEFQALVQQLQN